MKEQILENLTKIELVVKELEKRKKKEVYKNKSPIKYTKIKKCFR